MCDERRWLVEVSLYQDEEVLLRRLAGAEGVEPAVLAHRAMLWGLRRALAQYGTLDALPTLDELGQQPSGAPLFSQHLAHALSRPCGEPQSPSATAMPAPASVASERAWYRDPGSAGANDAAELAAGESNATPAAGNVRDTANHHRVYGVHDVNGDAAVAYRCADTLDATAISGDDLGDTMLPLLV
jgi:hypothetical protein